MQKRFVYIFFLALWYALGPVAAFADDEAQRIKEDFIEESIKQGNEAQKIVDEVEDYGKSIYDKIKAEALHTEVSVDKDSLKIAPLPYNPDQHWWWTLLKEKRLDLKDTTVRYPKFIKFCVDVYNWGDRTFNTFDPEYVQGTGKKWKVRLVSDNWLDTYALKLPQGVNTLMSSDVYANLGAYVQYMAVSIGSSYDVGKLFNNKEPSHKKYEFGFICALFNVELYYHENRGGTNIKRFGDYRVKRGEKDYFPGVEMYTLGVDAYYFFNHKRYSQGAAYNFAKYQLKSQGSFMLGFSFTNQRLNFDFSRLPEKLKPLLTIPEESNYYFHYNSYSLLFGYGYNWVIAPKLLFNASVMPSVGASYCYEDSLEGKKWMVSLNIAARVSLTYNLGNYFFGIFGKMKGQWYKSGAQSMFSSIENFSAYVGLRF